VTDFPDAARRLLRELGATDHPQPAVNAVIELAALFTHCLALLGKDPTQLSNELGSAGRIQQARLIHALNDARAATRVHLSTLGTVLTEDNNLRTTLLAALEPLTLAGDQLESVAEQLDPDGISYR
jgi:hypothetical protein